MLEADPGEMARELKRRANAWHWAGYFEGQIDAGGDDYGDDDDRPHTADEAAALTRKTAKEFQDQLIEFMRHVRDFERARAVRIARTARIGRYRLTAERVAVMIESEDTFALAGSLEFSGHEEFYAWKARQ